MVYLIYRRVINLLLFLSLSDLSDIRKNVPGEPGIDYPAYTTLPQTGFTCEGRSRGKYDVNKLSTHMPFHLLLYVMTYL